MPEGASRATKVETQELTSEELVAQESAKDEARAIETIKDTLYSGSIKGARYDPDIGAIVVENSDLKLKLVSLDNLDENWTKQQIESKLFEKIKKIEYGYLTENTGTISTFEKANEVAQKLNIKLDKNITPEQLVKIVAVTTAELLEYEYNALALTIDEVLDKGKAYCGTYADVSEYIADELIKKYNLPNIAIENISSRKHSKFGHVLNIVYVIDRNGNITASLFDPTWIDSRTGKIDLNKLNALDWQHVRIFDQSNVEDMMSVIEQLEKPDTEKIDQAYITAAVKTMQTIYRHAVFEGKDYQVVIKRMIDIFSDYKNNQNQLYIIYNFFWQELNSQVAEGELYEGTDEGKQCYKLAWELYKLAKEKFPADGKYKVTDELETKFVYRIPEEFKN